MDSNSDPNKKRLGFVEPWVGLVHCDPEILGGMPVFVGIRIPIENVAASLASGLSEDQVLKAYPQLTPVHVTAAIAFGAATLNAKAGHLERVEGRTAPTRKFFARPAAVAAVEKMARAVVVSVLPAFQGEWPSTTGQPSGADRHYDFLFGEGIVKRP